MQNPNSPIERHQEVVAVACHNASGEADVFVASVKVDATEYADGLHYERAKDQARQAGYETPMVAFDTSELPALVSGSDEAVSQAARHNGEAPFFDASFVWHEHRHGADSLMIVSRRTPIDAEVLVANAPQHFEIDGEDESIEMGSMPDSLYALVERLVHRAEIGHSDSIKTLDHLERVGLGTSLQPLEVAFVQRWNEADPANRMNVRKGQYEKRGDMVSLEGAQVITLESGAITLVRIPVEGGSFEYDVLMDGETIEVDEYYDDARAKADLPE
ncbi:hypothetical protein [Thioalkalivibrio sp. ALE16]|uniref:hypothetical protein n=1 Tax=Thioalkalivibrio sp. ALE16 TaxID=1158172 RepID=UPI0003745CB6|nr:hypothetical protein [Thioalkalivibrio sp. ALE16]